MRPIQTIQLMNVARKQAKALRDSESINSYCLEKYGRRPQIRLGYNAKKSPGREDCPVILIPRMSKAEGENESAFRYVTLLGWMICNEQEEDVDGINELIGLEECDKLGQLIYETLVHLNPSYPVTESVYELEAVEFFPQILGEMQITIDIPRIIGAKLEY